MPWAQVPSPVKELRFHKLHTTVEKNKQTKVSALTKDPCHLGRQEAHSSDHHNQAQGQPFFQAKDREPTKTSGAETRP